MIESWYIMKEKTIYALGFFDGVHIGHQALLKECRRLADAQGCKAAAVTFSSHPDTLVQGVAPRLINTIEDRVRLLKENGMDQVVVLPFDKKMMTMPWQEFLRFLVEAYSAAGLVCGHDFRFGRNGEGTPQKLADFCKQRGMGFDCISKISLDGITVSSTHIRSLLLEGMTARAVEFLGHGHLLTGKVVDGRKVGRTLGVPTANLQHAQGVLLPRNGVYAARAQVEGKVYAAVVNIGCRPTFGGENVTVEPWLLDYNCDLYGRELQLWLYAYLRPERKFGTPMELKAEILRNADQTRDILRTLPQGKW